MMVAKGADLEMSQDNFLTRMRRGAIRSGRWTIGHITRIPRWLLALFALLSVAALTLLAFLGGFIVASRDYAQIEILNKIDRKFEQLVLSRLSRETTLDTSLVRLVVEKGTVAEGALDLQMQWGGGLGSFGADVLVLPYRGRVYAARSPQTIRPTRIVAPDIGRAAYQRDYRALGDDPEFGSPPARGLDYLRYNDILVFDGVSRGLAVSYVEYHPDERCVTNTVAVREIAAANENVDDVVIGPDDWRILFRSRPCLSFKRKGVAMEGHMAAGGLAYSAPSTLYLTSGDFGFDGNRSDGGAISQDPDQGYGKVIALDVVSGTSRVVAAGLRNMQGVALTAGGALYTVEHGPLGGDELNMIVDGANYGWPLESYGIAYSKEPLPGSLSFGRHDTFTAPVFAWTPSVAASGLIAVKGFHSAWDGDLIVATLKDESIHRLRLDGGRVIYDERIAIGSRIRAIHQHTDGRVVLWSDNHELMFIEAKDLPSERERLEEYLRTSGTAVADQIRLRAAIGGCAECHSFSTTDDRGAPSLGRVYRDVIASRRFAGYSQALKSKGGRWTEENLAALIVDPQAFAPGMTMPGQGIDPVLARHIVEYLKYLDTLH